MQQRNDGMQLIGIRGSLFVPVPIRRSVSMIRTHNTIDGKAGVGISEHQ